MEYVSFFFFFLKYEVILLEWRRKSLQDIMPNGKTMMNNIV